MAEFRRVSPQAGVGGAEQQELGALARYTQEAIGQEATLVKAVAGTAAAGSLTFTTAGTAADTITLGTSVITLVASDPGDLEAVIGATAAETRDNVLAVLDAVAAAEGVAVASSSTAAITVTAVTPGVAGNAIVLAEDSTAVTLVVMTGGVDPIAGTAAPAGSIRVNGTEAWVAVKDTTETDTSGWLKLTTAGGL